jgi:exodeoxyribonuclease V gamma subunit
VLIGQLRDHLASGWRLAESEQNDPDALLHALTLEHPLQPFSARYFHEGNQQLFSYAREWQQLHNALPPGATATALGAYTPSAALSIAQLQDFLRHPVRHFYSQRLKVFFEAAQAPSPDEEPFSLDALQRYTLSESLLAAGMANVDSVDLALQSQARRLQGSGLLPMAGFGACLQAELIEPLPDLLARYRDLRVLWPITLESALPITFSHEGVTLEGWIGGLQQRADGGLLSVTTIANAIGGTRTRKWHRMIRCWVEHLSACAVGLPLTTALVASDDTLLLKPLSEDAAAERLRDLLSAWLVGMSAPLPVAVKTAFAWLGQSDPAKAHAAAGKAYEGDGITFDGERRESVALARQFPDFAAMLADETFSGWCDTLYRPLFEAPWQSVDAQEAQA